MDNSQSIAPESTEVFYEIREGEYIQFNMTLPIQMLFDDIASFVSVADC